MFARSAGLLDAQLIPNGAQPGITKSVGKNEKRMKIAVKALHKSPLAIDKSNHVCQHTSYGACLNCRLPFATKSADGHYYLKGFRLEWDHALLNKNVK